MVKSTGAPPIAYLASDKATSYPFRHGTTLAVEAEPSECSADGAALSAAADVTGSITLRVVTAKSAAADGVSVLSLSSGGTLTFRLKKFISGVANVQVYVKDNGGTQFGGCDRSTIKQFSITVKSVNNRPYWNATNLDRKSVV